ncbi:MAG: BatA domain-containing protein [Verrucomicrobiota bacterium]
MTFLEPLLLFALPLAALPVVIHLVHLYRRKQVQWAAMMFLLAAQQMQKGFSRLKQILILALRVAAVAAILLAITRPLSGGWLGLTGGAPDTVLVLLDRSASMEQHPASSSRSKRQTGLQNVSKAIQDAIGNRSHIVLLDSAASKPLLIEKPEALLLDLPQTEPSDTTADIPGLLQNALDYIVTNKTGRTDIWLISDLQKGDWNRSGGRWDTLRTAFSNTKGVRFHLLNYPQKTPDDFAIRIDHVTRRQTGDKAELLLDLKISRTAENLLPQEIPLRFVINGIATTSKVTIQDSQLSLQAYSLPIDKSLTRGWGYVELPADAYPANNTFHFVFDEPPVLRSVVVSEDSTDLRSITAGLGAPADPSRKYETLKLPLERTAEIPWEQTGLIVWQAPIPKPDSPVFQQLTEHIALGRTALFLPPNSPSESELCGLAWGKWETADPAKSPEWWRNDSGLLANTQDGIALPVGGLEVSRFCQITGSGVPLARTADGALLMRSAVQPNVYFLGTHPAPGASNLAREGVVLFALLHRALNEGAQTLGKAQQRVASPAPLPGNAEAWHVVDETKAGGRNSTNLNLRAGIIANDSALIALNRPASEDDLETLSTETVNELFAGLDFRILTDTLEGDHSLTNEVWRTFLFVMALALLGETLLCLPPAPSSAKG